MLAKVCSNKVKCVDLGKTPPPPEIEKMAPMWSIHCLNMVLIIIYAKHVFSEVTDQSIKVQTLSDK